MFYCFNSVICKAKLKVHTVSIRTQLFVNFLLSEEAACFNRWKLSWARTEFDLSAMRGVLLTFKPCNIIAIVGF